MKAYRFTIAGKLVTVDAVQTFGHDGKATNAVDFAATCETITRKGRMALYPKPDRTAAQLEKQLQDFAERLATQAAGARRSEAMLADIFRVTP